jgi:hypothetical protein
MRDQSRNIGLLLRSIYPLIPIWLIARGLDSAASRMRSSGRYQVSGLISNLGRIPVERFRTESFRASAAFFLPLNVDFIPSFFVLSGTENSLEILLGMPLALSCGGRIEKLMDRIAADLKKVLK